MAKKQVFDGKDIPDHFNPAEMEIIAAHIYAYQPYQEPDKPKNGYGLPSEYQFLGLMKQNRRPWHIPERLSYALKDFTKKMSTRPDVYKPFEIARYDAANNTIESEGFFDQRRREESRKIYRALMTWDENMLRAYANSPVGKVNEKYGFKKVTRLAPMQSETQSMSDLVGETRGPSMVDMANEAMGRPVEAEVHTISQTQEAPIEPKTDIPVTTKKRPGRPAKKTALVE